MRPAATTATVCALLAVAGCATVQADPAPTSEPAPATASASDRPQVDFSKIAVYDRAAYARDLTECDRLAAHGDDPEHLGEGVSQAEMDKPAAIAACHAAVAADPDNPRLNYQLARAYAYSGRHRDGDPYRIQAIHAGYPQSLFVFGYIRTLGWDGDAPDPCVGGELIRRSAHAGRFAGLVGFPHYALEGAFAGCATPRVDVAEMRGFLVTAEAEAQGDFYKTILVTQLRARLAERYGAEPLDE